MDAPAKQTHDHSPWQHAHSFHAPSAAAERGTRQVVWITLVMMVIEIAAGYGYNSMALLADGWHMSSHVLAIGLSALAYAAARRYAQDGRFAFGTWKIEVLASFASAIVLLGIDGMTIYSSIERLFTPQAIQYREALAVGVLGLGVNLVCALVLARAGKHDHHHDHHHGHGHGHGHDHPAHGIRRLRRGADARQRAGRQRHRNFHDPRSALPVQHEIHGLGDEPQLLRLSVLFSGDGQVDEPRSDRGEGRSEFVWDGGE